MAATFALANDAGSSSVESLTNVSDAGKTDTRPWDNSDPLFSAHARKLIVTVLECYIQQPIIFVGILGNIISSAVFWKQGLSDRINLLLFWLAVADLINLVTRWMFVAHCYNSDTIQYLSWVAILNAKIVYVNSWASFVSGTLIFILSVDRCVSVAMPLKARTLLTYRPMVAAIVLSYLVPVAFYLPGFLAFSVKWRVDPSTGRTVAYMAVSSWFSMGPKFATSFISFLGLFTKPPYFVIVVVCCLITISKLRQASRKRLSIMETTKAESDTGDNRITKMLLVVCAMYSALILPDACFSFVHLVIPGFFLYQRLHNTFIIMLHMLTFTPSCLNSAVNFFSYFLLSTKFRKTLKQMCHLKK